MKTQRMKPGNSKNFSLLESKLRKMVREELMGESGYVRHSLPTEIVKIIREYNISNSTALDIAEKIIDYLKSNDLLK